MLRRLLMRIGIMVSLLAWLSLASGAAAQQGVAINTERGQVMALSTSELSTMEQSVLAADARWAQAYQSCDMELMNKVLRDDVMFIHAHARVDTKQIVMKEFRLCTNEETVIEPIRVVVMSPDSALIEARMKARNKGQQKWIQFLYTRVYVRNGSDWRMLAHQTTFQLPEATPDEPGTAKR
jgi:ketosteroid isomerase-like protein